MEGAPVGRGAWGVFRQPTCWTAHERIGLVLSSFLRQMGAPVGQAHSHTCVQGQAASRTGVLGEYRPRARALGLPLSRFRLWYPWALLNLCLLRELP